MRECLSFGTWQGEPLMWTVLAEDDTALTLWCRRVIATMPFSRGNTAYYAESDVHPFLEGEFLEKAFSEAERARILPSELDLTEYQTYYGAVSSVGALMHRRPPLTAHVFLLSVREMMKTYALTAEELRHDGKARLWTRSPFSSQEASQVRADEGILQGESPYTYESTSHNPFTDTITTSTVPYSAYVRREAGIVPALRIRK